MLHLLLASYSEIAGMLTRAPGAPLRGMDYFSAIQNSFGGGLGGFYLILGCLSAAMATVLIVNALMRWRAAQAGRAREKGEPGALFKSLLREVDLSEKDKQTLQEIAACARLRHPATMLLSPGLLEWSRRLCDQEVEIGLPAEKWARIDEISHKLYDPAPATNSKITAAH